MMVTLLMFVIVGLVVAMVVRGRTPRPPRGLRAIQCPRCNVVQNVGTTERDCVCWRCDALIVLPDRHALAVVCPVCEESPGFECRDRRGRVMKYFHFKRTDAALRRQT